LGGAGVVGVKTGRAIKAGREGYMIEPGMLAGELFAR